MGGHDRTYGLRISRGFSRPPHQVIHSRSTFTLGYVSQSSFDTLTQVVSTMPGGADSDAAFWLPRGGNFNNTISWRVDRFAIAHHPMVQRRSISFR